MKLIVCLGNPGIEYENTRHNIGFRVGDHLIENWSLTKLGAKFKSILYKGTVNNQTVLLLKPQTFMNLSGEAVQLAAAFHKIPYDDVLVIYDDIDLPFGTIRYRDKGGAGTHNGMRSIISIIKTQEFPRLRIGIGPVPEKWDLSDFVLSNFTSEQEGVIDSIHGDSLTEISNSFLT